MNRTALFDPDPLGLLPGGGLETHHKVQEPLPAILDVVAVVSNPVRYNSRLSLCRAFQRHMACAGVRLTLVELAYGERPFEVTEEGNPRHVQLRAGTELWHKENLINLGIERLPRDWKYVAWIDADIAFARPDWAQETMQLLQHYAIIQMFSHATDLGPNHEPLKTHAGFVYSYQQGFPNDPRYEIWHPGFCWAARRDAINVLGTLIDFAILGSADRHMAMALIGKAVKTLHQDLTENYRNGVLAWETRAERYIQRNIGYMPGMIYHAWHGKKADRRYRDRWQVLIQNQYDPVVDLKRDWQGAWQLTDRSLGLREDIRAYFRARKEDSLDL